MSTHPAANPPATAALLTGNRLRRRGFRSVPTARPGRAAWWFCLLSSLYAATTAVVWMLAPSTYPYGRDDIIRVGFNVLIEREAGVVIALAAAVVGLTAVVARLRSREARPVLRVTGAVAVAEGLCFAFVLGDGAVMSLMGYLIALTVPPAVVVLLVLVGRHRPRVGFTVLTVAVALVAVGLVGGWLAEVAIAYAGYVSSVVPALFFGPYSLRVLLTLVWLLGAAGWALAALETFRSARSPVAPGWTRPEAVRRWGRVVTIAAALGPVPYGLVRLTWVTPWPLGGLGLDEFVISRELDLGTRILGFAFVTAVVLGVVLTLGLISRWGEVFPRWVPVVGGQAVPVMLAVVPGALVAAVITIAAPGMVIGNVLAGEPVELALTLLFFPFPIWGPLLGAAVFAYWLRRTRGEAPVSVASPTR